MLKKQRKKHQKGHQKKTPKRTPTYTPHKKGHPLIVRKKGTPEKAKKRDTHLLLTSFPSSAILRP
jgi:hypothetical protein